MLNCNTILKHTLNSSHLFDFVLLCVIMMNIEALSFFLNMYFSISFIIKEKFIIALIIPFISFPSEMCTVYFYSIVLFDFLSCKASHMYDACVWWCRWRFIVSESHLYYFYRHKANLL